MNTSQQSVKVVIEGKEYIVEVGDLKEYPIVVTVNGKQYEAFIDEKGDYVERIKEMPEIETVKSLSGPSRSIRETLRYNRWAESRLPALTRANAKVRRSEDSDRPASPPAHLIGHRYPPCADNPAGKAAGAESRPFLPDPGTPSVILLY